MRVRLALCALVLLVAPSGAAAQGLPNHERHVMSVGHADVLHITSHVDHFHVDVKDDSGDEPVFRKHGDVLLHAGPESEVAVPDHPDYAFLGKPGDPVWVLPEIQDENLLWPGLSAEEVAAGVFVDDSVRLQAVGFRGPDGLSLFSVGPNGEPIVLADSEDSLPDQLDLSAGSHQHANWAFEKAGTYRVTVVASATRLDGTRVVSDPAVLTFSVQH